MRKQRIDPQDTVLRHAVIGDLVLAACHPLVAATGLYLVDVATELEQRKKDRERGRSWIDRRDYMHVNLNLHGRIDTHGEGRLRIVATLKSAAWILAFHDRLLKAVQAAGCGIEVRPYRKKHSAFLTAYGAAVPLWFSEDFDKEKSETRPSLDAYVARDAYQVRAEPYSAHAPKVWRGRQQYLDDHIAEIAAGLVSLLAQEAKFNEQVEVDRQRREARAAEMKIWWAEQDFKRKRKEERRAQVDRLLQAASGHDEYLWAKKRLTEIEAAAPDDDAIRAWVAVVRDNLSDPHDALIKAIRAEAAKDEKPLWWPEPPSS